MPSIKRVFLDGNSIICDERLSDFAGELDNEDSKLYQIVMPNDLRCSFPPDSRGKSLASIDYKSLPKNDGSMMGKWVKDILFEILSTNTLKTDE